MKTPDMEALNMLKKASVLDPVIAGGKTETPSVEVASNTRVASNPGKAGKAGKSLVAGDVELAKFTIRIEKELMGRVRAAYLRDLSTGFCGSLSAWAVQGLQEAVARSEKHHNSGQPYQPIMKGSIPTGPMF